MKNIILLLFALVLTTFTNAKSVLNISADKVLFDQSKEVNTYRGNVILINGSHTIRADEVQSRKHQLGDQIIATGVPAVYQNKSEGLYISANEIYYHQYNQTLIFKRNVIVVSKQSRSESELLTYYLKSKKIVSSADKGGRVSSIITIN